ncbi:MAG: transposase, partial [Planctomycetaceae bacterium]|nr:transposase [Planctomycetaceae bacterium]
SGNEFTSKDLWHEVKPLVRSYETDDACLIFDDTIIPKPYMDENDIVCWHWDHSHGRNEKGINLLTAFYHSQPLDVSEALRVPISYECVKKTVHYCDLKTRKEKRQSEVSKNEMMRSMIAQAVQNQHLKFRYVLADSWFSSSDNMLFIHRLDKYFLMDMKSNRSCQFATSDRTKGQWNSLDKLPLIPEQPVKVWLKDLEIQVLLCKFVFTNKDGSTGEMYLVSNNLELSTEEFKTLYKKRWSVEEYHKSLKQNAALAKSPARTVTTQGNHLFASLVAYVKLEKLKFAHKLNHFALKAKIYWAASKAAWSELKKIKLEANA